VVEVGNETVFISFGEGVETVDILLEDFEGLLVCFELFWVE
jgi:hypothetical protein